ncbi:MULTISPECIES: hypothetical protein [unclassified Luteococcus]|uniref:hypothetical protein n=1 Tax=unclassified Luteococcus TaxID=2639923 RepID=UPI00313DF92F
MNTRTNFVAPYEEADRAAIRRLFHNLADDPAFLDKILHRLIADILQQQMASTWMKKAEHYDAAGERGLAARCRIQAHLLKDGDLTDPAIADDVLIYQAERVPAPAVAPMRDELLAMISDELRRNAA